MMSIKRTMIITTKRLIATIVIGTLIKIVVSMTLTVVTTRKLTREQIVISAATFLEMTSVITLISASTTEQHMKIFNVLSMMLYMAP
jgi:hypothetical protein